MTPHSQSPHEGKPDGPRPEPEHPASTGPQRAASFLSIEEIRGLAIAELRTKLAVKEGEEGSSPAWSQLPENYHELIRECLSVRPEAALPNPTVSVPLTFACVEPDPHGIEFLLKLSQRPDEAAAIYGEHPSPREACYVAAALLSGGAQSRRLGLLLVSATLDNDSLPGSPEAHLYADLILRIARRFGSEDERQFSLALLASHGESGSATWRKLLAHTLSYESNRNRLDAAAAILQAGPSPFYPVLLSVALARDTEPEVANVILRGIIDTPLAGTPALCRLLEKIASCADPDRRVEYGRLLSSIDGFTGEYWGSLAPWVFERPLRLLESCGLDPLEARKRLCPTIGHSSFLAAFNITDGDALALQLVERAFAPKPQLSEAENSSDAEHLRRGLIRGAFLAPSQQNLVQLAILTSQTEEQLYTCELCDILSRAATTQRTEIPQLSIVRLLATAKESDKCPKFLRDMMPPSLSEEDQDHWVTFLEIPPLLSSQEQVIHLLSTAPDTMSWLEDYGNMIRLLRHDSAQSSVVPFGGSRFGSTPVHEFLRAQTVEPGNPALLSLLGEALAATDISGDDPNSFARWRYDMRNPITARQLRSLSVEARETWSKDLSAMITEAPIGTAIPLRELGGNSRYLVLLTDHPELMFRIGTLPSITAACTSFKNGAFYSKTLVSLVSDAHIKGLFVFDAFKLQHVIAPHLPQEFQEALVSGYFPPHLLSRYMDGLMLAIEARAVVKLTETVEGAPVLLMEPSFVKGSLKKLHPTHESLLFMATVAEEMGAGLALPPYVNQTDYPLKTVVSPPSRSPGGQLANYDFAPWLAAHHGATAFCATLVKAPPTVPKK